MVPGLTSIERLPTSANRRTVTCRGLVGVTADEDLLRLKSMVGADFANGRNGVIKEGEG